MIKTLILAAIYILIGSGIVANCKSEKKNDPGFIAFVLIFWPLIVGLLILVVALALIIAGISHIFGNRSDK